MNQRRLIGRPRETPPDLRTTPGQSHAIPDDLLRQASGRLKVLALLAAMLWLLAPLGAHLALHLTWPNDPMWLQFTTNDGLAAIGLVSSLGLYLYLRKGDHNPAAVMDLGLVFMIAMAFVLGPLAHSGQRTNVATGVNPMITWIGPVILMTAAIVPVPPWKMLAAGLVAASM